MKKNMNIIKETVLSMGGTIEEFLPERNCFYVSVLGKRILLERKISITRNSFVGGELTRCKDITHKLLLAVGLPSPRTEAFYKKSFQPSKAKQRLATLKYPVIIKDSSGSNSVGIFPYILNKTEAFRVLKKQLPQYRNLVVQEMVFGKEYRLLVLGDKIIGALEMIPPYVLGDGVSTLRALINNKQKSTQRKTKVDTKFLQIIKDQQAALEKVVLKNKIVYLKKNACLAEGGEMKDVTDNVNEDVRKICVAASKVVGKYLVGIDVICKDISSKPTKKDFHILEINGKPDLYIHYSPQIGKSRNVVKDILKFMSKLAVPVIND
jgi:cyanophycin synthetase